MEQESSNLNHAIGWASGSAGFVAGAAGAGAVAAAIVAMCMMTPRSAREWAVGLISTVIGSLSGGATVIMYFHLQSWMYEPTGILAVLGIVFACGLPGWALVRWAFTWIIRREGKDLGEVYADAKATFKA